MVKPYENALNDFLVGFEMTPHVATGIQPANFLFQDGYRANFPYCHQLSSIQTVTAKKQDIQYHQTINTQSKQVNKKKERSIQNEW